MNVQPPLLAPAYKSTVARAPRQGLIPLVPDDMRGETGNGWSAPLPEGAGDLTRNARAGGAPVGECLNVVGTVCDPAGRPLAGVLLELWQANAAGRYAHPVDTHDAPLDPNFHGSGYVVTDEQGRYAFRTIRPGAYPWGNHANAWRPAHIHFSLLGPRLGARLVSQMYFEGDPLLALDPIFQSVPAAGRELLCARLDMAAGEEGVAIGLRFDIVLGAPGIGVEPV